MEDFLSFRRMVSPTLIQIVYWLATIVVVIVGLVLISRGGSVAAVGVGYLIVGPLLIRVYAEVSNFGIQGT